METIKITMLQFITENKFQNRDAEKLRGFFASSFKEEDLFHNHEPDGKSIYRFPKIQYCINNGYLTVFGYNEADKTVSEKFLNIKEIKINDEIIVNYETQLTVKNEPFFIDERLHEYKFESIWLPINQKNYFKYINQKLDLNKVLQNHILSNFKGLGITVKDKIMVNGKFREQSVYINNIEHFGFTGSFVSNAVIPDNMGFGKFKSVGFGRVRRAADA